MSWRHTLKQSWEQNTLGCLGSCISKHFGHCSFAGLPHLCALVGVRRHELCGMKWGPDKARFDLREKTMCSQSRTLRMAARWLPHVRFLVPCKGMQLRVNPSSLSDCAGNKALPLRVCLQSSHNLASQPTCPPYYVYTHKIYFMCPPPVSRLFGVSQAHIQASCNWKPASTLASWENPSGFSLAATRLDQCRLCSQSNTISTEVSVQ